MIMAESSGPSCCKPPLSKRKRLKSVEKSARVCIIHVAGLKCGPIKLFSQNESGDVDKFGRLHDIRHRRLAEAPDSPYRMEEVCNQLPDKFESHHGYHRECYQRLTMNLNRLQQQPNDLQSSSSSRHRRSIEEDKVIFKPDCIFCHSESHKAVKVKGTWTTKKMSTCRR